MTNGLFGAALGISTCITTLTRDVFTPPGLDLRMIGIDGPIMTGRWPRFRTGRLTRHVYIVFFHGREFQWPLKRKAA